MMKKLWVLMLMIVLVGCSATVTPEVEGDQSLQYILDRGKMVVGYTIYPPMGLKDEAGNVVGFDIDIAREVAERLGVELELVEIDWDAKTLELDAKNIDMIWNGLTITEPRKLEILFSKPYFDNRIVIMTNSQSDINSIQDLAGKKIGVEVSSSGQSALEGNAVFASLTEMVKFDKINEAVLDLQAGNIDAIVADEIFARYAVSKTADLFKVADEVFNSENYGIGFRLGEVALRDRIDAIIDEMAADGTASQISIEWFGEDLLLR